MGGDFSLIVGVAAQIPAGVHSTEMKSNHTDEAKGSEKQAVPVS